MEEYQILNMQRKALGSPPSSSCHWKRRIGFPHCWWSGSHFLQWHTFSILGSCYSRCETFRVGICISSKLKVKEKRKDHYMRDSRHGLYENEWDPLERKQRNNILNSLLPRHALNEVLPEVVEGNGNLHVVVHCILWMSTEQHHLCRTSTKMSKQSPSVGFYAKRTKIIIE